MRKFLIGLAALAVSGIVAYGANIPLFTGPFDPSNQLAHFNTLINEINVLVTPQSMATFTQPRNLLDNGQMQVQQRGTAAQTCGTTTIPSSAYSADRWGCNVNVGSGAGSLQVVTTNLPAQPTFNDALLFYRTSGTLAQPQCVMQEIPSTRIVPLQGQPVTVSFYAYGLANMLAEQTTLNAYLLTGTGTDQGLGSFTASPAITPAWTGIASTQTTAFTLTASYQRFSATYYIPATAKEAAIALCWTPTTGGTAGATDGFEFTGVQLEQGASASSFEYRPYADDLLIAQRYYWQINEPAASIGVGEGGSYETTTICGVPIKNPVTMRAAPTVTIGGTTESATTWAIISKSQTPVVLASTYLVQDATIGNSVDTTHLSATTTSTTAGFACMLVGAGGGANIQASADF